MTQPLIFLNQCIQTKKFNNFTSHPEDLDERLDPSPKSIRKIIMIIMILKGRIKEAIILTIITINYSAFVEEKNLKLPKMNQQPPKWIQSKNLVSEK